jgi:hypothetical protein
MYSSFKGGSEASPATGLKEEHGFIRLATRNLPLKKEGVGRITSRKLNVGNLQA